MRIGIDIRSLIEPFPSGISEYTFQVVKNLLKHNKDNEYILFYNSKKELPKVYAVEFKKYDAEIKASHWPNKIFNFLLFLKLFIKIDKYIGGVDIFYMPNINFYSLSGNTKLLLTVHDLSFEYPKYFKFKSDYWHKLINPKKIIKKATKIIAVSENTKQDIIDNYQTEANKIQVIYSGVDLSAFTNLLETKKKEIKEKYQLANNYLLYLGNMENRKNIDSIILAWYKIKNENNIDIQLVMVGKLNDRIIQKKYPTVKFTDYIDEEDKPYFYSQAKAFIYPSFYEGFGLPIIEAMAAGCPVITSFSTSLPEISGRAAIYIDPYNINECAKAMLDIIENNELRQSLIAQSDELVKKYSWGNTISKMNDLFINI